MSENAQASVVSAGNNTNICISVRWDVVNKDFSK